MNVLDQHHGRNFSVYNGDCVEFAAGLPDNSIDFTIYSPPFSNLFVYSDSERDMGNAADDDEFFEHYKFLLRELHRATRPGRNSAGARAYSPAARVMRRAYRCSGSINTR